MVLQALTIYFIGSFTTAFIGVVTTTSTNSFQSGSSFTTGKPQFVYWSFIDFIQSVELQENSSLILVFVPTNAGNSNSISFFAATGFGLTPE